MFPWLHLRELSQEYSQGKDGWIWDFGWKIANPVAGSSFPVSTTRCAFRLAFRVRTKLTMKFVVCCSMRMRRIVETSNGRLEALIKGLKLQARPLLFSPRVVLPIHKSLAGSRS